MATPTLMKTILVVDDEQVIRSLAEQALTTDTWQVRSAADAGTALAAIRERKPDLIFLDLGLPGVSGAELARRLRADEGTAAIPILYLTGLAPEACRDADGVVAKPFTPEKLRAHAANWL
jgi:two-component system phosphate regulon response regulator PhoB